MNSVITSVMITSTIVGIITMTLSIGIIVTSVVTRARASVAKAEGRTERHMHAGLQHTVALTAAG